MASADQDFVRLDTTREGWLPGLVDGLTVMPLHQFGGENVSLVKWRPGTRFQPHPGGEEILVLDGVLEDEHGRYPKGTWIRNPAGSVHAPVGTEGGTMYLKTGHLHQERSTGPSFADVAH